MSDHDEQIVAALYEVGGRHRTSETPDVRHLDAAELSELISNDGPSSTDTARAVYRARVESRRGRRGGGS
jgi:hypothetical protein